MPTSTTRAPAAPSGSSPAPATPTSSRSPAPRPRPTARSPPGATRHWPASRSPARTASAPTPPTRRSQATAAPATSPRRTRPRSRAATAASRSPRTARAPAGGSVSGIPAYDTDGTYSFTVATDTDGQSGIATQVLTREKATLSADGCGSYAADTTLTIAATVNETTLAGPQCYRYVLTTTDRVGNVHAITSSAVKVDKTAPTTPTLTPSTAGANVYYPGAGSDRLVQARRRRRQRRHDHRRLDRARHGDPSLELPDTCRLHARRLERRPHLHRQRPARRRRRQRQRHRDEHGRPHERQRRFSLDRGQHARRRAAPSRASPPTTPTAPSASPSRPTPTGSPASRRRC